MVHADALRRWYEPRRRRYPWRGTRDPYLVLVSEVMLQQTQAARAAPAFTAFVERFPTVASLAAARREEVVRAWGTLGYNRRAVALSEAARAIVRDHGGHVPSDVEALRALPGVGPYTASAVAALAFGTPVPALDTNVRRVVARVALGEEWHEVVSGVVEEAAAGLLDRRDAATWNQAVMDLGRDVCLPVPRCVACPLASSCAFRVSGRAAARAPRRQGAFEGSFRQVRGAVVRALRETSSATLGGLATTTGHSVERVTDAVRALEAEGIVEAGAAALRGSPRGRLRLASA